MVSLIDDAWGNCVVIDPATGLDTDDIEFIGHQNPFRYRGYFWDSDLQLYYIQGRYYDPQTGRFISSANTSALNPYVINGLNLYSYASNNPVNIAHNGSRAISTMSSAPVLQGTMYNDTQNYRLLPDGFLYDTLGFASNVFEIIDKFDSSGQYGSISDALGFTNAIIDGLRVMDETNDPMESFLTFLYDLSSASLSAWIGKLIGGTIGNIPGAIIGTIASLALDAVFQYFKENVVSWVYDAWDAFWEWVLGSQNSLVNG